MLFYCFFCFFSIAYRSVVFKEYYVKFIDYYVVGNQ